MTNPVKNVQLTGYVGTQAGNVQSTTLSYTDAGAVFGAEAKYGGAFLRGQIGAGTAFSGKIQAGYEFDISKNMGLELSAKGQVGISAKPVHVSSLMYVEHSGHTSVSNSETGESINQAYRVTSSDEVGFYVPNGENKACAEAMLKFKSKHVDAGFGIQGGIHKGMVKDIDAVITTVNEMTVLNGEQTNTDAIVTTDKINLLKGDKAELYTTPTGFLKIKPNEKLAIKLEGNLYEQNIGLECKLQNKAKKPNERPWDGN